MRTIGIGCALLLIGIPAFAQDPEFLVDVRRLNKVENPTDISVWVGYNGNCQPGSPRCAPNDESRNSVIWISDRPATEFATTPIGPVNSNIYVEKDGNSYRGWIQAPVDYTVCKAAVNQFDGNRPADSFRGGYGPSLNCGNTFNASYRTADDPESAKIDGLHFYMVVNKPKLFGGRCWVDGVVTVTFVRASSKNKYDFCRKSGEIAWTYGK